MSGVFKAIGKVFKKVVNVVKKVAPFALAGAAVIFTGGAALGILPSFSTAVGGLVSALGVGSKLAPILTGAITNAGFGSALGGIVGGKDGMTTGLMAGALQGAISGASKIPGASVAPKGVAVQDVIPNGAPVPDNSWTVPIDGSTVGAPAATPMAQTSLAPAAAASSPLSTGLLGSPLVQAQLLQGFGNALMGSSAQKAQQRANDAEAANYSIEGGLLDPNVLAGQTPAAPGQFAAGAPLKWTYDARQGKMVRTG